ncbi:hypothetical protein FVF72_00815 [Methanothermobacter sp. KEPCO-1]|uniref:right-handed parallel beta-helix repeat-containing protein n=1 Tax=Methanothermobacter sp. KEPCO-1 TaxID=2603820 RepID=UPI0011C9F6B9|nr:right-handed parallel beta-helix repeat-containing protein [Methanothermobacter sp. KEPCO-1]QEF93824.1 hypothetical protein FVF72_00815 [Methanothermobacter sp. KEPCO-1]
MIKHLYVIAAIAVLLILSGTASAADIYVNATGGSDDNDGLSWAAAKATIGNATLSAASGDRIWLADGEYRGDGNRDVVIDRNLTITGQSTTGTVIDCEYLGRAFSVQQGVSFTLRNLTVKRGNENHGGAILNQGNLTVEGCTFLENMGYRGGAINSRGNTHITSATFQDNSASETGGALHVAGYQPSDSAVVIDSSFTSNDAKYGGAVATDYTRPLNVLLRGSTFSGNTAWYGGGFLADNVNATVEGCTFEENVASAHGGAIRNNYGNLTVRRSTFTDNSAGFAGGGISNVRAALANITESTFTGNLAETWSQGSAVLSYFTIALVNFCRILNNPGADVFCEDGPQVDARFNWWGSNTPDFTELTAGDVDATPWIILTLVANPSTVTVGGTSLIRADLLHDSAGTLHATSVPYTGVVGFETTYGTITDALMSGGVASSTLRNLNAPGVAVVSAVLDNQVVNTQVTVRPAPPATGITINQLVAAAVNVRNHYLRYRKLPASVTIASKRYSMAQFLDLLARATVQLNSGNQNPLRPRAVGYAGSTGIWRSGKLSRPAYVSVAVSIRNFINSQGRAPRYASTVYGRVSFAGLVYRYSEVLRFYGNRGRLPNYLII